MALRDLLLVEQTMGAVQISDRNISPANTSKKGTFRSYRSDLQVAFSSEQDDLLTAESQRGIGVPGKRWFCGCWGEELLPLERSAAKD
jgi:hypothetical protein